MICGSALKDHAAAEATWDGIETPGIWNEGFESQRRDLARAARHYQWSTVLELVRANPDQVNGRGIGGTAGFTALHQAAHGNAPAPVIEELISLGAWRTIRNSKGERPLEVALRQGNHHLVEVLTPKLLHPLDEPTLALFERDVHAVMLEKAGNCILANGVKLPPMAPLQELIVPNLWCIVPGMMGGFCVILEFRSGEPHLLVRAISRCCDDYPEMVDVITRKGRRIEEYQRPRN